MKTMITSNWRTLCRDLCTLLLCIAALWVMPRSAHAQIYAGQSVNDTVDTYNATTGFVDPNVTTITANGPFRLAVSGNGLFVANASSIDTVGEYNLIKGAFTPIIITVPNAAYGPAVAPVSEPSPWSLIAVGGVALMGFMARRRRCATKR